MNKTIGILAHVDAGKTTFSEQLLFNTKSIRQRGRVDHQDAFLDSHEIEKQRGITIFADQAEISFNGSTYYLIDTPGHVDFSPEMERAIQVMDYAILIVSAIDGIEGHTETVWQLLQKHKIPTFFFINKTDRDNADPQRVLEEIRTSLSLDAIDLTDDFQNGSMSEELIEFIAERDEELLERYMDSGYNPDMWMTALKRLVNSRQVMAGCHGSALKDDGVMEFFELIDRLTESDYEAQLPFSALVYKIRHEPSGQRVTYLKVLSGRLQVREEIAYQANGENINEKVTQLRRYTGDKFAAVEFANAGELIAVTGLSKSVIGTGLGAVNAAPSYLATPALQSKVNFSPAIHPKEMLKVFKLLDAEDPSLHVTWDEHFQEIHILVMGVIQLEVLGQIVLERFGFTVSFEPPKILYKETIAHSVMGYGHFEPLRHYAEVHLKIEPAPRGSGITLANECHADDLSTGHQNLILHHLQEREHHGILTGSSLTDVQITLMTGRGHNQHTSGGDFREAAYRALRQGLEKAENRLLEPMYRFKIKVDTEHMGKVLSDIQQAHGTFEAPVMTEGKTLINGSVPVASFMHYPTEFASFTHGKGMLSLLSDGYGFCHNEEEIIEQIGYNKDADPEYTSTSIFCAKGQGYKVPWQEAEDAMHCL